MIKNSKNLSLCHPYPLSLYNGAVTGIVSVLLGLSWTNQRTGSAVLDVFAFPAGSVGVKILFCEQFDWKIVEVCP